MGRTFTQVDDTERRLVKSMRKAKLSWEVMQKITGRSPDTLNSILNPKTSTPKTKGQPRKIPVKMLPKIFKVTTRLQMKAKAEEEVTADMILKAAGVKACDRTLASPPIDVTLPHVACEGRQSTYVLASF